MVVVITDDDHNHVNQYSYLPLSESFCVSTYSCDSSSLGIDCVFVCARFINVAFCYCVCCSVPFCCLFVYTYDFKCIAGVLSCQELDGHPITARHSYASRFLNSMEG